MKVVVMLIIGVALLSNDPLRTGKVNKAKSRAKEAFNSGDFQTAIQQYKYLIDSLGVQEPEVTLNLAHAYYLAKDTTNAFSTYQSVSSSSESAVSSIANQQLGVMSNMRGKAEEALNYFKQSIKADPRNEQARYNYEMVKKKLEQKRKEEEQKKKDQNKDQQNKDQQPSEFAKKLKAQADRLVEQKQYRQAYQLMMDGMKKDQTVSTYQDYINRIKVVSDIND
jgi:tetratricopeptide (TPR) repeat protein